MRTEPGLAAPMPDADACLARPTVTCSVDLALAVSTDHDDERARLVLRASRQLKKPVARKAYFDRTVAQYFVGGTSGLPLLAHERRVADIATAIVAGDEAGADRLFAEDKDHFQRWWTMLVDVLNTLATAGRPDLAVATEARHHRQTNVGRSDALGRKLGDEVWTTREPLARALVDCACGPDPLPMVLALPNQDDRLELAALLYARRHDMPGLTSLLTREFGDLARIKDKTQRRRIGYAFGLMLRELPLSDIPQALRARPAWLTANDFERPPRSGMSAPRNSYGAVLARAVAAGDRAAVSAIVKLRPRSNTVWLSGATIDSLDAAARVAPVLPKPERDHLRMLTIKFMIAHGDAHKGVQEALTSPMARGWGRLRISDEDSTQFEATVLEPLLARGEFDVADAAVRRLRDRDTRAVMQETIASARTAGAKTKDAATILAARWSAYQKAKTEAGARRDFLFAVRDLIAAQPNAFPFE